MIALRIVIAFLILLLFGIPLATTVAAQDLEAAATHLEINELAGVQRAVSRTYATDVTDIVRAASDEEAEPEDAGISEGPLTMMVLVAEFDTDANGSRAFETLSERLQSQMEAMSGQDIELTDVDDLGDTAIQVSTTPGADAMQVSAVLAHDGAWVYLAIAVSEDDSAPGAAHEAVNYSLRQAAQDDATIYLHTGRSSGGIWSKLPGTGSSTSALNGTQPIYDSQILPPPAGNGT